MTLKQRRKYVYNVLVKTVLSDTFMDFLFLTIHIARHTFATLMLANGVSIENVAKMLGHSDTKMTRHYAQILDSSIMRDMEKAQDSIRFD